MCSIACQCLLLLCQYWICLTKLTSSLRRKRKLAHIISRIHKRWLVIGLWRLREGRVKWQKSHLYRSAIEVPLWTRVDWPTSLQYDFKYDMNLVSSLHLRKRRPIRYLASFATFVAWFLEYFHLSLSAKCALAYF